MQIWVEQRQGRARYAVIRLERKVVKRECNVVDWSETEGEVKFDFLN